MRLVDCFYELFYYTVFLKSLSISQIPYSGVIKHYKQLFSRALNSARKVGFSEKDFRSALFGVCAWIDEALIFSEWSEREKWSKAPLQLNLFNTTNAGDEFFVRLNEMSESAQSIREVYEYCLALGFKGRYYNTNDEDKLNEIKTANLQLITNNINLEFPTTFFPEAYASNFEPPRKKKYFRKTGLLSALLFILASSVFFIMLMVFRNTLCQFVLKHFY